MAKKVKKEKKAPVLLPFVWLFLSFIITAFAFYEYTSHYMISNLGALLFAAPYLIFIGFLALRTQWKKHWFSATLWSLILFAAPVYGYYYWTHELPQEIPPKVGIRVLSYNVHYFNNDAENIEQRLNYIKKLDADILSFYEVNTHWDDALLSLKEDYPYIKDSSDTRNHYVGKMVLLSKYPLGAIEGDTFHDAFHPMTALVTPHHQIELVQFHPLPPVNEALHTKRNQAYKTLAEQTFTSPKIILGDFNTVPWQNPFQSLLETQNLKRASHILPTWPRFFPLAPIDHILIDNDLHSAQNGRLCLHGSDHCLVYADITHYLK